MLNIGYTEATIEDCELLTQTAKKAKQFWGYSDALMEKWQDDLAITPTSFLDRSIYKCYVDSDFIGFFVLKDMNGYAELDGLWILPEYHGKGYGRSMIEKAKAVSVEKKYRYIELYSDPNADGFYQRCKAQLVGKVETKIKDRYLNIYRFDLL
ncbi:GNAT family N-acetyltransferase [Myroides sp. WP-1]|uniref:GNAT family N-acetyltransferase n=1 Tax=Myroides sp. WP-1 TaxID=2759944 RepID=UPI0021033853|nr:GNAT family N-acetyltransferase [Myroides sp. WP-1]